MSNISNFQDKALQLIGNLNSSTKSLWDGTNMVNFLKDDDNVELIVFGLTAACLAKSFRNVGSNRKSYNNSLMLGCIFEMSTKNDTAQLTKLLSHFIPETQRLSIANVTMALEKAAASTDPAKLQAIINGGKYKKDFYQGFDKLAKVWEDNKSTYGQTVVNRLSSEIAQGIEAIEAPSEAKETVKK